MKRAGRWLFNFAAGVSLVMLVAMAAMWVRSYYRNDLKISKRGLTQRSVFTALGSVRYLHVEFAYPVEKRYEDFGWYSRQVGAHDTLALTFGSRTLDLGFGGLHLIEGDWRRGMSTGDAPMPYRAIIVPYWLLTAVSAAIPFIWLVRYARRRGRLYTGFCPACGYDLRATPERCPECGTAVERTAAPLTIRGK